jgi:hypothetical protein
MVYQERYFIYQERQIFTDYLLERKDFGIKSYRLLIKLLGEEGDELNPIAVPNSPARLTMHSPARIPFVHNTPSPVLSSRSSQSSRSSPINNPIPKKTLIH